MKQLFYIYCISLFGFLSYVQPQKTIEKSISDGKEIYQDFCVQCHLDNGKGVPGTFPPLAKSDYLQNNIEASIRGIKYGQRGKITVNGIDYDGIMSHQGLVDEEVADVMNYILNSWGNVTKGQISISQVAEVQKK
jgi:mono/diheme cytochrome c family protein